MGIETNLHGTVAKEQLHARPRSAAVDAVRVVGIVAIVLGHTWPDASGARNVIGLWRVAAFFLLAGYMWSGTRPLLRDAEHRARGLLRPYVTWLAVIGAPFVLLKIVHHESAVRLVGGLVRGQQLGRPFSAFWFIAVLFLMGVALRASQALPRGLVGALVVTGALATVVWGPLMARTPYSLGMVPIACFFALAGQEFRRYRTAIGRPLLTGLVLLGVWLAAVLIGVDPLDLKYGVTGTPVVSLLTSIAAGAGLILTAEALVPDLPQPLQSWLTRLAEVGIVVLLLHAAVLYATDSLANLPLAFCFVAALVVPWTVGLILARTPLSSWTLGRRFVV